MNHHPDRHPDPHDPAAPGAEKKAAESASAPGSGRELAPEGLQWSAGALWPALGLAGAVALGAGAVLAGDALGRVFLGAAAVVLACWAGLTLWRRPGLRLVDDALVVRSPLGSRIIPLSEVVEVRALAQSRTGLRSHVLRVEYRDPRGEAELAVLTRGDLGADPRDVHDALLEAGLPGQDV